MECPDAMSSIPVLELTKYESGSVEERSDFCAQLFAALSEYGFAKIVRHGIPDHVLEDVFSWVSVNTCTFLSRLSVDWIYLVTQNKRFFSMPKEHKAKAAHPSHPNPHRGWSSVGQEKLSVIRLGRPVLDLKVCFTESAYFVSSSALRFC